jgi:dTDP-4-dehydrorhamnose 3,5-epimerase
MKFSETNLHGLFLIEPELIEDERGLFARSWSSEEFVEHGLNNRLAECDISFNRLKGTVRGMHFQIAPHEEAKLVRCTRGAIFDVAVDIRPDSPTRYRSASFELTADNRRMLYVPEGFAHGYQTLEDATEIFYLISESYHSDSARGLRWNDPRLKIEWPLEVSLISARDREFELL